MLRAITVALLASFASAQLTGLSTQCTNALASIVADSGANSCLSPTSLLPIATSNSSVVGPLNTWATNICSVAPCSNQTLSNVVNIITSGCQREISGGDTSVDPASLAQAITPTIQQFYPTVRKIICLKDGNTICLTELLTSIEQSTGPLNIQSIIGFVMGSGSPLQNIPRNVTCSDCVKAAYNILNQDVPSLVSDAAPALQTECGSSFTDGNTPSTITQSAINAADSSGGSSNDNGTTDNSNGASGFLPSGLAVSALAIAAVLL